MTMCKVSILFPVWNPIQGYAADEIFDAAQLEVVNQDYFGTGKTPPKDVISVGHTFLDYAISWK